MKRYGKISKDMKACCRNKLKTAGGYIWRYKENNITQKTKKQLIQEIDQLINQLAQEKEKNKKLSEELTDQICKNVEAEVFEEMRLELKQEKEKNKELTDEYMIQKYLINADFLKDYISKDKIKEKIESIENMFEVCDEEINHKLKIEDKAKIEVLKELLEEK